MRSTRFINEWSYVTVRKIIIHRYSSGVRGAIVEKGKVSEWLIEQKQTGEIAPGAIIQGKVTDILPGMDAAFVDIGTEKNGFLLRKELIEYQKDKTSGEEVTNKEITSLLTKGQRIIVQVKKEETGTKGAKLTEVLSFPGKYIVYLPHGGYVAVSKKMASDISRDAWRVNGQEWIDGTEGIIFRTLAEEAEIEEVHQEFKSLRDEYQTIAALGNGNSAKVMPLYNESSIFARISRDFLYDDRTSIVVDDREDYRRLRKQLPEEKMSKLEFYQGNEDIFSYYDLQIALDKTLKPFLWLKNGGSLFINYTEAMTVIDVNTAKFTGKRDQKETAYRTNQEAAAVIAEQLRLREIGGIVLVDFIDMKSDYERQQILQTMKRCLQSDRTITNVLGFTKLGLLEMTRKKTRKPLHESLQTTCDVCNGTGLIKDSEEAARELEDHVFSLRNEIEDALLIEAEERVVSLFSVSDSERLKQLKNASGKELFLVVSNSVKGHEIRLSGDYDHVLQQWKKRQ